METTNNLDLTKLNLGGGLTTLEGFTNVDKYKSEKTDLVVDLEVYPWPFPTSSVKDTVLRHVLEHIKEPIPFMNELYRILEPGGRVQYRGPHSRSQGAWQDPTHVRPIPEEFFLYFTKRFRHENVIVYSGINTDFTLDGPYYCLDSEYEKKRADGLTDEQLMYDVRHLNNVVSELCWILTAIK